MESEKNDPNEFWKTIDKFKNRSSDPSSGISSDEWLTHFRDLMNVDYTNTFEVLQNVSLADYDSNVLNSEIRAEGVYKAVKTLKNQKACGTEGINNEMLKLACSMNVDIFVKVFNMIKNLKYILSCGEKIILNQFLRGDVSIILQIIED